MSDTMNNQPAALQEFLAEADEILDRVTTNLGLIEKRLGRDDTVNVIYRDVHTLKGTAQLFGCGQLALVTHTIETALAPARDVNLPITPELVDAIYAGIDLCRQLTAALRATQQEVELPNELSKVIPRLSDAATALFGLPALATRDVILPMDTTSPRILDLPLKAALPIAAAHAPSAVSLNQGSPSVRQDSTPPVVSAPAAAASAAGAPETVGDVLRVPVGLLDSLMNLVGELVLIRNQVIQVTASSEDDEFVNLSQRLNIVTTELQNEVMKTRMQPIGNILTKFQRIVRDMSRELGKNIDLKLEGVETELDKTLIEAVKDPLTHIVRNSVDHGIEMPEVRRQAGKTTTGQIIIRSYHEGGQVIVEIIDDGQGINRARIGKKAVEKNLITAEQLQAMSDREVVSLIFAPGFSTAEKISNISGRGVGMDVVRTNIEKIGGVVDIQSVEGQGTTMSLKIPLTLAIVPALIVRSGSERFAIPQVKLVQLVRSERQESGENQDIQMLEGQPVFRLRGNLLPLVSVNQLLGLPVDFAEKDATNIAVLNADSCQFGLIVDAIEDSTDIVVKPLNASLKNIGVYSGATVLGDGAVALVLDVAGLAARAQVVGDKVAQGSAAVLTEEQKKNTELTEYLLIDIGVNGRYAIPLCLVNRLEEFSPEQLEWSGDQRVVRYRDSIMPVVSTIEKLGIKVQTDRLKKDEANRNVPVVVVERGGRHFGLVVEAIRDVVSIEGRIDDGVADRASILGNVLHADGVIVVIDVYKIIGTLIGDQTDSNEKRPAQYSSDVTARRAMHQILYAEDNIFFRKHVTHVLTGAGFNVTTDVDGEAAHQRLDRGAKDAFTAVLTDIEMPKLDGFGLVTKLRADQRFASLPVFALTTRASQKDLSRGREAGFSKYLVKLNPEQLISELDESLGINLATTPNRRFGT